MKRPKVGIGVIIVKEDKVLLIKRQGSHGEGTWSLPGGHLEFNESFEDCSKREVMEEVGLNIKDLRFAALTNDLFEKEDDHYITIFMLSDWESGEPKIMEPDKTTEIGWFEWDKLPEPLFLPLKNLLDQYYNPF